MKPTFACRVKISFVLVTGHRSLVTLGFADWKCAQGPCVWMRRSLHQIFFHIAAKFFAKEISSLFPKRFSAWCTK